MTYEEKDKLSDDINALLNMKPLADIVEVLSIVLAYQYNCKPREPINELIVELNLMKKTIDDTLDHIDENRGKEND